MVCLNDDKYVKLTVSGNEFQTFSELPTCIEDRCLHLHFVD